MSKKVQFLGDILVPTDKTLTKDGISADAKTVGEKIQNIYDNYTTVEHVESLINESISDLGYIDVTNEYLENGFEHILTLETGKYCYIDVYKYYCDVVCFGEYTYLTIRGYGDDSIFTEQHYINGEMVYELEAHEEGGTQIRGICDPEQDNQAANKHYVDQTISDALNAIGFAEEVSY